MEIIRENILRADYGKIQLAKDEYFALMVEDHSNKFSRPKSDYIDFQKGWVGLERTSKPSRIYVSKWFFSRFHPYRGSTVIVKVSKDDKIYILDEK